MTNLRPPPYRLSGLDAVSQFIERQPKPLVAAGGVVLIGILGLLDYGLATWHIALPIFYLIPVVGLAWFVGWRTGAAASLLSGLVSFLIHFSLAGRFSNPMLVHVTSAAFFIACLFAARMTFTVRLMVEYSHRGDRWKAIFKPRRIGQRLIVVPAWLYESQAKDLASRTSDIPLLLDPGMAFGTGSHPTTQMCLAMLETYLKPDDHVFDVGCGTGILSITAAKLGARSVLAVDIDPEAVRVARNNAELNGVADRMEFRLGSLDTVFTPPSDIPPSEFPSQSGQQSSSGNSQFNLTIANILADMLIDLLSEGLARTIVPDGVLILSGIRAEQTESVAAALQAAGLTLIDQRQTWKWVAMAARSPASAR